MVSEQAILDHFLQCMSPTSSENSKLGLALVSLEENLSRTPKKPSMVEENKNDGADDPISMMLEHALTRQRDEMMENFPHILQHLPIVTGAYSSSGHFRGTSPFKVQVNFDIPVFEGQIIDAYHIAIVTTKTIQPEEPIDPKEGEHLFHSQLWVEGTPLLFIVDSGSQKNLISAEVVKQLGLSTTPHLHPYNIRWLHQG